MKNLKHKLLILYITVLLMFICPALVLAQAKSNQKIKIAASGPIVVKSQKFEIDNKRFIVTFSGNVDARRGDLIINCKKMLLYYRNSSESKGQEKMQASVDKIIASGDVKITRPEGGQATAEKAVYYSDDEKVVLTGSPVVKQGDDFVEGSKITLFLNENRSIVEGSADSRARAVLFPKKK